MDISKDECLLRFTIVGSVDDGKSTLLGRLLHDSDGVYEDQLASVYRASRNGLDLALITDGLRAEREQGITIDVAYRYFSTQRRRFIVADTPGHEQYTRNMATGASLAELAVILVDAQKGVLEQTRRHVYVAWLMGIRKAVLAINKMDLVGYRQSVFDAICGQFRIMIQNLTTLEVFYIPVSAVDGDNVVRHSDHMPWFVGNSLLEHLERVPLARKACAAPLRFPVQYVIRGDSLYRGYAGQIASGELETGSEVVVLPSGQRTRIASIETFGNRLVRAGAPLSVTLTLEGQTDVSRGDMIVTPDMLPTVAPKLVATVVWMAETPLTLKHLYLLKHTTRYVRAEISRLISKIDLRSFEETSAISLDMNEIGTVEINAYSPLFYDTYTDIQSTGRFILIDAITNQTVGAGMIGNAIKEFRSSSRNIREHSGLTVWFTGLSSSGKTTLSYAVRDRLLAMGYRVECLDGDIVRRYLCQELAFTKKDRDENIRRIAYVAELLTRNNVIVLVSAISPYRDVRDEVRARIGSFVEVYVNAPLATCEERDVKGLYRKARAGQLSGFTGVDDPYEPPLTPEIECHTDSESISESTDKVLKYLNFSNY